MCCYQGGRRPTPWKFLNRPPEDFEENWVPPVKEELPETSGDFEANAKSSDSF